MLHTRTVHVSSLDERALEQLRTDLLDLHVRIFGGSGHGDSVKILTDTSTEERYVARVYTDEGRLVGFYGALFPEIEIEGRTIRVMRAISGLLPEARGGRHCATFFLVQALKVLLTLPARPTYLFAPLAHVSSFRVISRNVETFFPSARGDVDPEVEQIHAALAARFGGARVEGDHPWVCRRTIHVPTAPSPRPRPRGEPDVLDRFWASVMPQSPDGRCLMVVVPVTARNLLATAWQSLRNGLARRCQVMAENLLASSVRHGSRGGAAEPWTEKGVL